MRDYILPSIIMVTALAIAFGAALFTVLGFRELFGDTFNIVYMAASIEIGKIVAVSAMYQFRDVLGMWIKASLFTLIVSVMAVTSMGVYGYLSSSYEKDSISLTQNDARMGLLDKRKGVLETRLDGMDVQIAAVPEAYVSKRMELMDKFAPERDRVLQEIDALESEKLELTLKRIDSETEFGAVLLLAKSIDGLDSDKAMLYFILLVIFIFDPLAIALTYTANVAFSNAANKPKPTVADDLIDNSIDTDELSGKIDTLLQEAAADKEESSTAIHTLAETVKTVADELNKLKTTKTTDTRSSVIDSMRNKTLDL